MRILVTGAKGQLGYDVVKELKRRNIGCLGTSHKDFDMADEKETADFLLAYRPDGVVHCAAYTAVDKAEDDIEQCNAVNVNGTSNIAKACKMVNAKMIYISTDYVFPGQGLKFYETEDETGPLNSYGWSKLEGELAVKEILHECFIVRTSWVFGINGNNFVKTMLKLSESKEEVSVVNDQSGSPTYTPDLAALLCDMIMTDRYGTYHATNEGTCTWAQFAEEIFKATNRSTRVNYISTEEYPTKAVRPNNSKLSKQSLDDGGFYRLPEWKDALHRYIKELQYESGKRVF